MHLSFSFLFFLSLSLFFPRCIAVLLGSRQALDLMTAAKQTTFGQTITRPRFRDCGGLENPRSTTLSLSPSHISLSPWATDEMRIVSRNKVSKSHGMTASALKRALASLPRVCSRFGRNVMFFHLAKSWQSSAEHAATHNEEQRT